MIPIPVPIPAQFGFLDSDSDSDSSKNGVIPQPIPIPESESCITDLVYLSVLLESIIKATEYRSTQEAPILVDYEIPIYQSVL